MRIPLRVGDNDNRSPHSQRDATYAHRIIRLLDGQIVSENINRPLEKSTSSKNEAV